VATRQARLNPHFGRKYNMANLVAKVPAASWLQAARETLVDHGIDAVKVDRLARQLGVTRGGFYHHFTDRDDLLSRLLQDWLATVVFVAEEPVPANPGHALAAIDVLVERLIQEDGYDPRFDLAVRAWAHADPRTAEVVQRVDARRLEALTRIFTALGCEGEEAVVRARVFYFHQIGYYFIDMHEGQAARRQRAATYIEILCGKQHLAAARAWVRANRMATPGGRR
jgi:AcrR family transcriptional regulator